MYLNIRVSRHLKEEPAWTVDIWFRVISNTMLFKAVIPLRPNEQSHFKVKITLYALLCDL